MRLDKREYTLSQRSVPIAVLALAIPAALGAFASYLESAVVVTFVGHLGTSYIAAMNLWLPFSFITLGPTMMINVGGSVFLSQALGEGRKHVAGRILSGYLYMGTLFLVPGLVIIYIFAAPLVEFFGATETVTPLATKYVRWMVFTQFFAQIANLLISALRSEGSTLISLVCMGLVVVLVPLFCYIFITFAHMDLVGASIAQSLAWGFSLLLALGYYKFRYSLIRLEWTRPIFNLRIFAAIRRRGLAMLVGCLFQAVIYFLGNNAVNAYGDAALAAFGLAEFCGVLIFFVLGGIGQGFRTLFSYALGAKNFHRAQASFFWTFSFFMVISLFSFFFFKFHPQSVVRLFSDDPVVIRYTTFALDVFSWPLLLAPLGELFFHFFIVVGKQTRTVSSSLLRGIMICFLIFYGSYKDNLYIILLSLGLGEAAFQLPMILASFFDKDARLYVYTRRFRANLPRPKALTQEEEPPLPI